MIKRIRLLVTGRVQGVGFRPTVYRHATGLSLSGFVKNTPSGVILEIQGEAKAVDDFIDHLKSAPPKQAHIESIHAEALPVCNDTGTFEIISSSRSGDLRVGMPPDLAVCEECRAELLDPANRRYRYPFINCTNCGPRFTIIRALPYDRKRTSMAAFELCPDCRTEYLNPIDRRFDAQPNACPVCGPAVTLIRTSGSPVATPLPPSRSPSADGRRMGRRGDPPATGPVAGLAEAGPAKPAGSTTPPTTMNDTTVQEAIRILKAGAILAVKGIGGYHLCCDASSNAAVALLRSRKNRPKKSLAVMFTSLEDIQRHCEVNAIEAAALSDGAAPIVILRRQRSSTLSPLISPDTNDLGAFLPYSPLHHLLLAGISPLVMTSGNRAEEPIVLDEQHLSQILGPIADAALIHNRPILRRCDDSVLKIVNGQGVCEERPRRSVALHNQKMVQMEGRAPSRPNTSSSVSRRLILRRSRGIVPDPIQLPLDGPPVLACGADLKNTISVTRGNQAFLSQHIGDLEDYQAYRFFRETINDLIQLLQVQPALIAYDLHPDYHSTRYALSPEVGFHGDRPGRLQPLTRVAVQHHHAHIAACMAEHHLTEPVIGVALDGTGFGPDHTIWGGEFLIADLEHYRRVAHFKPYRMPGGPEAILHPVRMAFSVLMTELASKDMSLVPDLLPNLSGQEQTTLTLMIEQAVHSPFTSSAGRLFDAMAALLGVGEAISYEAQAAIRLQTLADRTVSEHYPFEMKHGTDDCWTLCFGPMIRAVITDLRSSIDRRLIAGMFHNTVAEAISQMCATLRTCEGLNAVVLSGGVFQNDLVLERTTKGLLQQGLRVYSHHVVPPNDGGIALGQAVVALQKCRMQNFRQSGSAAGGKNVEWKRAG